MATTRCTPRHRLLATILPRMGLAHRGAEWGGGQWASFFCLENEHWRIIGIDTGYNSTRFDWGKRPLVQRSMATPDDGVQAGVRDSPSPAPLARDRGEAGWRQARTGPTVASRAAFRLLALVSDSAAPTGQADSPSGDLVLGARAQGRDLRPICRVGRHPTYGRCVGHGGMPVERGARPDIQDCRWLA